MKRLELYFSQDMYDPNAKVITQIITIPYNIQFVRENKENGIVLTSIHTGNRRAFTHWASKNIAGLERYEFINHHLGVKLYLDIDEKN